MRIGGFQLNGPVPQLNNATVLAILRPWIDVNNVGSLLLNDLEKRFGAIELGRLARPGSYYDLTRYRPIIHLEDGIRDLSVPNTMIHYAKVEGHSDLILLRLLEPHANAEHYVSSVLRTLKALNARKYVLLGSMYDVVPHTRPLFVSGYGMGEEALSDIRKAQALPITYQGPSTIANLITKEAAESGIDAAVFIVSLPQYVVLEEDHAGKVRLMEVLNTLYDIPIDQGELDKAFEQRNLISEQLKGSPEVNALLPQLENAYDMRIKAMEEQGVSHAGMEGIFWKVFGNNIGKA